ncbi:MAG: hypothetical protein M3457_22055 [Chloroflexota bacterium]|nr:hypothetical protein [Chloroflexota bacterium]
MTDRTGDSARIRVDSADEQYAYLLARFGDPSLWSVQSQMFELTADGREAERVDVTLAAGELARVTFVSSQEEDSFDSPVVDEDGTGFLDRVMESAFAFSESNPPHHPGTLARFPVPSAGYANALSVPMPVLALEGGKRGLYAPPRVVVIDYGTGDARGVGEYPGFDPERWPPERLGDWPPQTLTGLHRLQLQGTIMRFSAVWNRILEAWFAKEIMDSPDLTADVAEALETRVILDLPELLPYYDRLNPVFAKWLARHSVTG